MRYLTALTISLICFHTSVVAAEKKSPADACTQRIGAIVNRLIDSELPKLPDLRNAFSVKLRYHVAPSSRVQRIEIISAQPDRSAANTIARLIRSTTFPPFPKDLLQQADDIVGELEWKWIPQKAEAGQPQAFLRVAIHPEPHSCVHAIVAIDGKSLPSPMKQASLSAGRHHLSIRVWTGDAQNKVVHADAPLEESFKPHHYWIDGEMSQSGLFKLVLEDEDERPSNIKHHPKTK